MSRKVAAVGLIAGLAGLGLGATTSQAATVDSFTSGDLLVAIGEEPTDSQTSTGSLASAGTLDGTSAASSGPGTSATGGGGTGAAAVAGAGTPTAPEGAASPGYYEGAPLAPIATLKPLPRVADEEDEDDEASDREVDEALLGWSTGPILGGTMVVATQDSVTATYLGGGTGYPTSLFLGAPIEHPRFLFSNETPLDWTIDLGPFTPGTELTFGLDVAVPDSPFQIFTGAGSRNPDGLPHVLAVTEFDPGLQTFVTNVGFEAFFGDGDQDTYDDFVFRLMGVVDPAPVPEPGTLALLGLGLASIPLVRRRKRA